ncbi:MAG: acetylglutamate kinase [Candidatus Micrarchaeia archaeon]
MDEKKTKAPSTTADVLIQKITPHASRHKGKAFVVKYGGNAMKSDGLKKSVMADIARLSSIGIRVVVVHGGGPDITERMKAAGVEPKFVNGLRVTDQATLDIVKEASAEINAEICGLLKANGIRAQNVQGTVIAQQKNAELGLVGKVIGVKTEKITKVLDANQIPVISPLGIAADNKTYYNVNADTVAVKVAIALGAEKLVLLTDVDGVLENGKVISKMTASQVQEKTASGVITKGMIPKTEACVEAVQAGCGDAVLLNGTTAHALLFDILQDDIGTEIVK